MQFSNLSKIFSVSLKNTNGGGKTLLHNLEGGAKPNVHMPGLNIAGCGPLSNGKTVIPQ